LRISPIFDRVLVEKIAAPEKIGSFYIPDGAKDPSQLCLVVEVGTGRNIDAPGAYEADGGEGVGSWVVHVQRPAMLVKPGDKVLIGKYSGSEVELNGKTLFILREDEILAIVHEDAAEQVPADEAEAVA